VHWCRLRALIDAPDKRSVTARLSAALPGSNRATTAIRMVGRATGPSGVPQARKRRSGIFATGRSRMGKRLLVQIKHTISLEPGIRSSK